jgi:kynurenine formamidase
MAIARRLYKAMYIDLSVPLNGQAPVYPGDPNTEVVPAGTLDKAGYNDHHISFGNI